MSRALKEDDVLELSKLYEAEFNRPELHDRILVFDVVASLSLDDAMADDEDSKEINSEESNDSRDKRESMADEIEGNDESTDNQNKAGSYDCEIISKYENGDQGTEINTEAEIETAESNPNEKPNEESSEMADENESGYASQEKSKTTEDDVRSSVSGDKENENTSIYEASHQSESETSYNQSGNLKEASSPDHKAFNLSSSKFIRQHRFYIHSSWLALQSSYFRSLLFGGMKESNFTEVHIQISASEEQAHLMLLEAMYKIDILDKSSVDELLEVLKLSHKYDVKFVFKKCKYSLQVAADSLDNCKQIMKFIKINNNIIDVEDLASTLQSFLAKEFSPLDRTWQTTSFKELSEPSVRYLLSSDELIANSENTIFHALIFWIEQNGIDNLLNFQELPSLLSVVRFELMPIDYLYNIVQHSSVAKRFTDFKELYLRGITYHALPHDILQTLPSQSPRKTQDSEDMVSYTWVIPEQKLYELAGTEEVLKSSAFFFCGYKMILTIHNVEKISNCNTAINAILSLKIVNLKQHSAVGISWQPQSQAFQCSTHQQKHTFKYDDCVVSLNATIKMFVEKQRSQSAFSFGVPVYQSTSLFGSSKPTCTPATGTNLFGCSQGANSTKSTSLSIAIKTMLL